MRKIEVKKLTKKYGSTTALDCINLQLEDKKIYGLLGRNGAGKTTLLSLLCNRIFPDEGEILIDGENILKHNRKIREMYCTSEKMLYPENMKVSEAFNWTAGFYDSFDKEKANLLSEKFELNSNKRIKNLSTGYDTIVKNIIALSVNTSILLFDEPVLGVDPNHRDLFYKELIKCYSEEPKTIVLSTHLIDEIDSVIEKVIILDKGAILINEDVNDLICKGYMVSGPKENVDIFVKNKYVIGTEMLAEQRTAYLFEESELRAEEIGALSVSRLPLQKLFVHLTNGGYIQ